MSSIHSTPLHLVFDVDGVILDYTAAYEAIIRAFGADPQRRPGRHYHAFNQFGFNPQELSESDRARFFELFDQQGWLSMPALPGAVEAMRSLERAGHRISYLTSMPTHRADHRRENFRKLGLPDGPLVATGHRLHSHHHPKAEHLMSWRPDWFVDDWAHNFKGFDPLPHPPGTRFALIMDGTPDHPSLHQDRHLAHAEFDSLPAFAEALLSGSLSEPSSNRSL